MDLNGTSHCRTVTAETFTRGDAKNYTFNNRGFKRYSLNVDPRENSRSVLLQLMQILVNK